MRKTIGYVLLFLNVFNLLASISKGNTEGIIVCTIGTLFSLFLTVRYIKK